MLPTYETPSDLLTAAIDSVLAQLYPDWELCIADDGSPGDNVWRALEAQAEAGVRKSFTSLHDEFLFIDENARGILSLQRAADALFPGEDAIGKRMVPGSNDPAAEVIGIVADRDGATEDFDWDAYITNLGGHLSGPQATIRAPSSRSRQSPSSRCSRWPSG